MASTASSSSFVSCYDLSLVLAFLRPSIQEAQVRLPAHRKDTAEHESILRCDESKTEGCHCWPQFQTVHHARRYRIFDPLNHA